MGAQVVLDDLGAGGASMHSLRELRPDLVKLDRALLLGLSYDASRQRLVSAMIDFAHELGIRVVAHGVEDEDDLGAIASLGADCVEGFLLGQPAAWMDSLSMSAQEALQPAALTHPPTCQPAKRRLRRSAPCGRTRWPARESGEQLGGRVDGQVCALVPARPGPCRPPRSAARPHCRRAAARPQRRRPGHLGRHRRTPPRRGRSGEQRLDGPPLVRPGRAQLEHELAGLDHQAVLVGQRRDRLAQPVQRRSGSASRRTCSPSASPLSSMCTSSRPSSASRSGSRPPYPVHAGVRVAAR